MEAVLAIVILTVIVAAFALPIQWSSDRESKKHDPSRAAFSAPVSISRGTFELFVPAGEAAELFIRVALTVDPEFGYDILVRGEVEDGNERQLFAWKTDRRSELDTAESAENVTHYYSAGATAQSIKLADLGPTSCTVTGTFAHADAVADAWVYVPRRQSILLGTVKTDKLGP